MTKDLAEIKKYPFGGWQQNTEMDDFICYDSVLIMNCDLILDNRVKS